MKLSNIAAPIRLTGNADDARHREMISARMRETKKTKAKLLADPRGSRLLRDVN